VHVSASPSTSPKSDEELLAELGYKQELSRTWSSFSNFAISFSIISILAGCFTTFGQAWNNGGPIAISIGWPIVSVFILIIGLCMSELVSAYPTSGGIYWWASKLGGVKAGYYTGWLNLIGLLAIDASVAYGAATFFDLSFSTMSESWAAGYSLSRVFVMFLVVLVLTALINIFGGHLLALLNNISVWWHVIGAAVIILILVFLPDKHMSIADVFTMRVNNSGGLAGGQDSGIGFWFYVLPLGFLLTQYTITGFDASAHLSEETHGAADGAAKGIWRSILYSAIGGWFLLLAFLFAVQDPAGVTAGGGGVAVIFNQALSSGWAGTVLLIASIAQVFCTAACMTSTSRMLFAFSRDGAVPGSSRWARLNARKVPANAVIVSSVIAAIITLPALVEVNLGTADAPLIVPVAFYAVVSVGVIGLYTAFAIPIYLRWRQGDAFPQGRWNLGRKWRWMAPVAVAEIAIISVYFILPFTPAANPFHETFEWKFVNYAPILMGGTLIALWVGWHLSAKKWFTGPKVTLDLPDGVSGADEIALEHHGGSAHGGVAHDGPAEPGPKH
jgi:amino acid transporter